MKHKFSLNCEIEFEPNSCDTNPLDEIDTQLAGLILREAISHKLSDLLPRNEYIDIFDTDIGSIYTVYNLIIKSISYEK